MAVHYNRTSIKLRMIGHFGTSPTAADYWSSGLRLAIVGGNDVALNDLTPFLNAIQVAIATFHATGTVGAGPNTYLDELTAAHIGLDGKYVSSMEQTTRYKYGSPIVGAGSGNHPWSTAMVTSLRTLFARGLASNGRMYWPAVGLGLSSGTGRVPAATMDNYVVEVKTMLNAINTAAQSYQTGLRIHVLGYSPKYGTSASSMVNAIRCDERLDSIERRENDQPAVWHSQTLT